MFRCHSLTSNNPLGSLLRIVRIQLKINPASAYIVVDVFRLRARYVEYPHWRNNYWPERAPISSVDSLSLQMARHEWTSDLCSVPMSSTWEEGEPRSWVRYINIHTFQQLIKPRKFETYIWTSPTIAASVLWIAPSKTNVSSSQARFMATSLEDWENFSWRGKQERKIRWVLNT